VSAGRPARQGVLGLFLVLVGTTIGAQDLSIDTRTEVGFFNRAYQDRQYLTSNMVSFGVPYLALGVEGRRKDAEGNVLALGLAQTSIGSGRVYNWDRWETQPLTLWNWASVSVGKDFGWWELDLGVGGLVQVVDFGADDYLAPDGSTEPGKAGGLGWNRQESFTVLTGLLRIFPESGPHLDLASARGPLSLTENLLHLRGTWPLGSNQLDGELGFSSPLGLVFHGAGVLRSNERLTVGWSVVTPAGTVGARLGCLLRTIIEGSGEVDLLHRLSFGIDWSAGGHEK
jgi:hypothetical protein